MNGNANKTIILLTVVILDSTNSSDLSAMVYDHEYTMTNNKHGQKRCNKCRIHHLLAIQPGQLSLKRFLLGCRQKIIIRLITPSESPVGCTDRSHIRFEWIATVVYS